MLMRRGLGGMCLAIGLLAVLGNTNQVAAEDKREAEQAGEAGDREADQPPSRRHRYPCDLLTIGEQVRVGGPLKALLAAGASASPAGGYVLRGLVEDRPGRPAPTVVAFAVSTVVIAVRIGGGHPGHATMVPSRPASREFGPAGRVTAAFPERVAPPVGTRFTVHDEFAAH